MGFDGPGWNSRTPSKILWSLVMWATVAIIITPLLWAILTSFKPDSETLSYPPAVLPHAPTFHNYTQLFKVLPFANFYWNTIEVATISSVLTIVLASFAAYSMARFRAFSTEIAGFVGLAAYMLPGILIIVPVFRIAHALGALDSLTSIIGLYTAYFLPFAVWQLRSYFAGMPREIEDAAMVDGATRFEAFYLVVLPQALPGLIAVGIFCFAVVWNEYLFASLLLFTPTNQTLSAGLAHTLIGTFDLYSWGVLMAGCTLTTLPLLFIFMVVQRQLIAGVSSGSVKG